MPVCDSQPRVYFVACIAVVGGWMTFVVQTLLIITAFNLTDRGHQAVISKHDWDERWKSVCCCVNIEENKHVFSTLSKLCMELFKKEDLVASDILAGLVLVYFKQHQTREQLDVVDAPLLNDRLRSRPHKLAKSPSVDRRPWMTFHNAAHYMKFSLGSYGWFYYIGLNNPIIATCQLLPKLSWGVKHQPAQIENDNRFMANTCAFCLQTGCKVEDIVYASYHNEIYSVPFYVVLDCESKSVIVAIRGTLSLEDILTDLVLVRAPVRYAGMDCTVHTGMLQSAKYVKNRLITEGILDVAFQSGKDYRLVITGHSLGAGVAALLALELRPLYNDLICFAFAVPGELISANLVPYTEEFICSVVLGYDVVPRLGLLRVQQLRIDILNALKECKLPKHKILSSGYWEFIFGKANLDECLDNHVPSEQCCWFEKYIEEEIAERDRVLLNFEPLMPPGQILHVLEKYDPKRPWNVQPEYYAEWTDAQTFQDIVLSRRMIAHHFPDTLLKALQQLKDHRNFSTKKGN